MTIVLVNRMKNACRVKEKTLQQRKAVDLRDMISVAYNVNYGYYIRSFLHKQLLVFVL